jgi:hypothetical protein
MILRSIDGKFYEIPDVEVAQYLIPADKVQETLRAISPPPSQQAGMVQAYHGPPPPPFGPGPFGPPPPFGPAPLPFLGPPPPPVYNNYYNYNNYWGGW